MMRPGQRMRRWSGMSAPYGNGRRRLRIDAQVLAPRDAPTRDVPFGVERTRVVITRDEASGLTYASRNAQRRA